MPMSKRNLIVLSVVGLVGIALWMFLSMSDSNTDQAHRQNLRRYGDSYFRLNDLEHRLGGDFAKLIGVQALERRYERKADAEREALLASGYLVRVCAVVTNLESRTEEVNERFRHIEGDPESLTIFDTRSNRVSVICRPQYAPIYQEALQR